MASSLAKINQQIAKLQKQAEAIQNTVIARIRREIAQHGLTADQLFGAASGSVENGKAAGAAKRRPAVKAPKAGADKPVKFADGAGNTWHGIGKRPGWIHEALASGHSLEEFLVGGEREPALSEGTKAKPAKKASRARKPSAKKAVKLSKPASGRKATPRRAARATTAAKKAPAKKVAAKKSSRKKSVPAQAADGQASEATA